MIYIVLTIVWLCLSLSVHATGETLVSIGERSIGNPVSGSVGYAGAQSLTNLRVQIVPVERGDVFSENQVGIGENFILNTPIEEPFYVVALADVVGQNVTLYGTPNGCLLPTVFTPEGIEPIDAGNIVLEDLAPPSREIVGTPYTEGSLTLFPVYHYFFVYNWDYSDHLYRSGDFLYLKKHEHRHLAEIYTTTMDEGMIWLKVANLTNGDSWQRTEVANYEGGMLLYIFRYYEYAEQDSSGSHDVQLLVKTNCHNIMVNKTLTNPAGTQRFWYVNDNVVRRESVVNPDNPDIMTNGNIWQFSSLMTTDKPSNVVYDWRAVAADPRGIILDWQAPAADGIHTWTSYRIYRSSQIFAEVPYNFTRWSTEDLELSETYLFTVRATDGTDESDPSNPVVLMSVANDDPLAIIPAPGIYPNPARNGAEIGIKLSDAAGLSGTLNIYNMRGQKVHAQGFSDGKETLTWDGRNDSGSSCATGVYMLRISVPGRETFSAKLTLIK